MLDPNGGLGDVVLADPDEASRAVMCGLLEDAGHETLAVASGEEALDAVRERGPRLVVLEVCLPGICGYEVCRRLRDEHGEALSIVLVSGTRTESFDRVAGILLGADDYLAKPLAADEFLARVGRLTKRGKVAGMSCGLTAREREVLGLLQEGLRQREIAGRLCISHKTVGTHLEHIFSKLGARNRLQAISIAHRRGLLGNGGAESGVGFAANAEAASPEKAPAEALDPG